MIEEKEEKQEIGAFHFMWLKLKEVMREMAENGSETNPFDVLDAMAVIETRVSEIVKKNKEPEQDEGEEVE